MLETRAPRCRTTSIRARSIPKAPDKPTAITVAFERGDATAIDGKTLSPAALLTRLNELGRANGMPGSISWKIALLGMRVV